MVLLICDVVRCAVDEVCAPEKNNNQQSKQMIKNKAIYVVTHCEVRFYWYLTGGRWQSNVRASETEWMKMNDW